MKRIKLVVFFILGLFMLTSCSMFSHESFPSGPQIEEPGTNPDVEVSSYLITYYENGLKVHQESLESGKTLPQVESTKAPLGQEFMGWSTSKEEYVPVDFDVMPESDVDLYAFYQKVKYTITFNANISLPDGTTTTKEYEYHDRLGEFVPSDLQEIIDAQTDYVFVGWFLDSQFKEEFVEVSMPAEDIVLYAKWQFSGIRFMNGLEVFYEVKDDEGASVQAPLQNPTKPGYDFVGWVDAKGNAVSFPLIVTDEVQFIYAAFEAKNNMSYKVEHYLENLNGTFVRQEVEELFGSTDSEVEALWKSYTGFSKDETNENNVLKGIVNYNGTLVLKLYYSRNSYKVSFETNGGSAIQAVSYKYEQMVAAPSSPNKLGYTFAGWELNGESYSFTNMPAHDIELSAKWQVVEYTVTFVAAELVGKVTYTVENKNITEPAVPSVEHFTGAWEEYELTTGNITVKAVYTPVTYTVTFKAEGVTVDTENYTVVNPTITEPAVPAKEHYTGVWESYVLVGGNVEVEAVYTPVTYYVTFVAEGTEVAKLPYTVENKAVVNPAVPAKAHYTGVWESYTLTSGNVEVEAVYTPVTYYVTFVAEGSEVAKLPYTVENKAVVNPAVPAKAHYTGVWESYTLTSGNVEVEAVYTPVTYYVTFVAEGTEVAKLPYTVENKAVVNPAVPAKAHYTGVWESYTLTSGNVEVEAVYTPVTYYVTFVAEGTEVAKLPYTVENKAVVNPAVPAKAHYTGVWESYTLTSGNVEVNAIYTPVTYTVTFKADGETVDVQEVTILDLTIVEPVVPAKLGYNASWETYTVALENIVVNAVYELVEYTITYNTNDGVVDVDVIIAEFLNDYNTARGKSHTVESFVELGSWGEISDASLFLYNSEYKAKWSWLVKYIASVASSANKPAYDVFFDFNSQSELNAADSDHIYRIAYELRGWVGQTQYTKNVNFKTADYSKAEVQEKLINYYFAYKYNVNTDTFELNGLVKEHYEFAGWYNNPEFTGDAITQIAKGSTGDQVLYAKFVGIPYYASLEVNGGQLDPSHYGVITDGDPSKTITIGSYSNTGLASGIYFCDKGVTSNNSLRWQYKILLQYDAELNAYEVVCLDAAKASANNAASAAGVTWTHALSSAGSNITTLVTVGQYIVLSRDVVNKDENFEGYAYHASQISVGIKPIEFAIDREDVLLPTPTKEGFEFVGWYNNPEFTGEAITKIVTGTAGNLKLYAKFESLGYSININPNGGLVDDSYYQLVTEGSAKGTITISEYSNTGLASGIYFCDTGVLPQNSLRWQYKILLQYDAELNAYKVVCLDAQAQSANNAASAAGVTWTHALSSASSNITTLVTIGQYIVLSKDVVLNDTNFEGYVYDDTQFVKKIKTMYYTVESEDIILPTPTKAHYDFNGWYDNPEFTGEAITKIAKGSTGNKQLYAKFTPTEYKVTFKSEVSEDIVKTYTIENPTIEEPTVPTKTGYTGVWESYTLTSGNVEVEAVYTPVTYYVTFVAEGTEVAKLPYTVENTTIVEPAVPAKTGYTAAWESYSVVNGNITVNAVYTVNQYTISFNTNGGSSVAAITQNYGTTVVAPANPTKSGYVFKGWSPELPTVMGTENITVTAIWEELKSTSISFDTTDNRTSLSTTQQVWEQAGIIVTNNKNESTTNVADYSNPARFYKSSDVIIEYPYPIYEIVIEMSGGTKYYIPQTYTIDGAKLTVDDSVATYTLDTPSTSFTMSKLPNQVRVSMITIKTIETCKTYTIDFNSNGGSGSIDSLSDLSAAEVSIPSSTGLTAPTNMKFDSWNTSADGTGTSYQAGDSIVLTSDLTLYAIWVENDPVEMTISEALNQPDGTNVIINGAVQSINYAWSDSNNNMSVTIKDDTGTIYIFKLNTKVNLGDKVTITGTIGSYNGSKQIAEGATAVITGTVNVLITFDVTGGTGNVESMSVLLGSTIVLPDATSVTAPSGKQFKEWNSKEDGTGISYVAGSNYVALDNATIYAIWEDQNIVDDTKYFEKVTTDQADWSGTYLIVYEAEQFILNGSLTTLDAANNYKTVSIVDNKIEYTDALSAFVVVITKSGSSYTIKTASGYYIGNTADSNKLNSSTSTNYTNTITLNSDGTVNIKGSGGSYLRFNTTSGQDRFRYFKSTTYTNQKPVTLYKLS